MTGSVLAFYWCNYHSGKRVSLRKLPFQTHYSQRVGHRQPGQHTRTHTRTHKLLFNSSPLIPVLSLIRFSGLFHTSFSTLCSSFDFLNSKIFFSFYLSAIKTATSQLNWNTVFFTGLVNKAHSGVLNVVIQLFLYLNLMLTFSRFQTNPPSSSSFSSSIQPISPLSVFPPPPPPFTSPAALCLAWEACSLMSREVWKLPETQPERNAVSRCEPTNVWMFTWNELERHGWSRLKGGRRWKREPRGKCIGKMGESQMISDDTKKREGKRSWKGDLNKQKPESHRTSVGL